MEIGLVCALLSWKHSPITTVNLAGNSISSVGALTLGEWLQIQHTVTNLDLAGNPLGDEGLMRVCEGVKAGNRLLSLNLAAVGGTNASGKCLRDMLAIPNSSLQRLMLNFNELDARSVAEILEGLMSNTTLKQLSIAYVTVSDQPLASPTQSGLGLTTPVPNEIFSKRGESDTKGLISNIYYGQLEYARQKLSKQFKQKIRWEASHDSDEPSDKSTEHLNTNLFGPTDLTAIEELFSALPSDGLEVVHIQGLVLFHFVFVYHLFPLASGITWRQVYRAVMTRSATAPLLVR